MSPECFAALNANRDKIREKWDVLLHVDGSVGGPLGNPDALKHLIPESLRELFIGLDTHAPAPAAVLEAKTRLPRYECRKNPYWGYFVAGEQAVLEALIEAQIGLPPPERRPEDLAETISAVRRLARRETETFCAVCLHRGTIAECRHRIPHPDTSVVLARIEWEPGAALPR